MNFIPKHGNHKVRVHSVFREHQKTVNTAWQEYYEAVQESGIDSGEAMAAQMHLRDTRWRLHQFIQHPRVEG